MGNQRKASQSNKKKKRWFNIHTSNEFGGGFIGESYAFEIESLIGKRLDVDLSSVSKTRNPNVRLVFEIKKIVEGKAIAEPIGYYVMNAYLKRIVRKGKTKLDDSYRLKSKDGVNCEIKIFSITKSKVQSKVSKSLKKELVSLVKSEFSKKTFDQLYDSILAYDLQKTLKTSLSKIYPLQSLEIRLFYKK